MDIMTKHELKTGSFLCQELIVTSLNTTSVVADLEDKAMKLPSIYKNLNFTINFRLLKDNDGFLEKEKEVVKRYIDALVGLGHRVVGLTGVSHKVSKILGVTLLKESVDNEVSILSGKKQDKNEQPEAKATTNTEGSVDDSILVYKGVVRGGTTIYGENKHVMIIGSVQNGAEVISDGCITITGSLKGRACAGVKSKNSYIYAKEFTPELISISSVYIINEEINKEFIGKSCVASLSDCGEKIMMCEGDY